MPRLARITAGVHVELDPVGSEELPERAEDRPAHAAVTRRMVGERWRAERWRGRCQRMEQRLPRGVGLGGRVPVGGGLLDRRPRPPEVPVVLVVPARDRAVRRGEVDHRKQACLPRGVELPCGREVTREPVVENGRRELPEDRRRRLVGRACRARPCAERLHLVEVLRVGRTRHGVRALRAELRRALDGEGLQVSDPRVGVGRRRRERPPAARIGAEVERERGHVPVRRPGVEHRLRGGRAHADALVLRRRGQDRSERRGVSRVELGHPRGIDDRHEHVVCSRCDRRVAGAERLRPERS